MNSSPNTCAFDKNENVLETKMATYTEVRPLTTKGYFQENRIKGKTFRSQLYLFSYFCSEKQRKYLSNVDNVKADRDWHF